ncbi:LacI family DNA-binding transcriptional regulator (plasmid) [Sinorhizobium medicae]|uniref:LacI family DNA-binding transcriptional regulator n=1 Tax=Sinorhizobium medicae TaxID=110321 RepID=UPI00299E470C|nr:LacI family DNA-binding transcriptional regulator [Sinorhizobium medicae]MDX0494879.1 substrate-binding domain-containing protein [Sinorhizobium medicae]WQO62963.1 LacI family DNA-binding transcriptional regulator [Sinorhizobium medicae]WQO89454.1 LacI family DNA-binding transcriptional regulator [Sinorhizobium medicae]
MVGGANKAATIREVAALAGVAPGTVSNVLTGKKLVAEPLRKTVLDAIAQLDYRPNHLASSLRFGRTKSIGIVVPDMTNPFFSGLVRELELKAAKSGFQILLMSSHEEAAEERERIRALVSRQVDGLIISPSRDSIETSPHSAISGIPTVLVDRAFAVEGFDTVSADNEQATLMGTRHLIELGHKRITFLATAPGLANMEERVSGYRKAAMQDAGVSDANVVYGGLSIESCRSAIEQELRRAGRPTAVFASAYVATLGAAKAIRALDLAFPQDVSLLGFDDSDWMTVLRPYVSTIEQPLDELGHACWELLQRRMKKMDVPPVHRRIACTLRARESTRRIRQKSGPRSRSEV